MKKETQIGCKGRKIRKGSVASFCTEPRMSSGVVGTTLGTMTSWAQDVSYINYIQNNTYSMLKKKNSYILLNITCYKAVHSASVMVYTFTYQLPNKEKGHWIYSSLCISQVMSTRNIRYKSHTMPFRELWKVIISAHVGL